jgi:hypothetical protein
MAEREKRTMMIKQKTGSNGCSFFQLDQWESQQVIESIGY